MGSDVFVVPVSWSRLTEVVMPAWREVLMRERTMRAFGDELAPDRDEEYPLHWHHDEIPQGWDDQRRYLAELGWDSRRPIVAADQLRRSSLHAQLLRGAFGDACAAVLRRAIYLSASAELAGDDPFTADPERYYGRMHGEPHRQVAGNKNRYHFLGHIVEYTWQRERSEYDIAIRTDVDARLRALLAALWFATRSFPGLKTLSRNDTWPAADDSWLLGVLAPDEVVELASYLDVLAGLCPPEPGQYHLLPLFADRVRRSAEQGLGLVTLYAW